MDVLENVLGKFQSLLQFLLMSPMRGHRRHELQPLFFAIDAIFVANGMKHLKRIPLKAFYNDAIEPETTAPVLQEEYLNWMDARDESMQMNREFSKDSSFSPFFFPWIFEPRLKNVFVRIDSKLQQREERRKQMLSFLQVPGQFNLQ